jgi:hypothetical protein
MSYKHSQKLIATFSHVIFEIKIDHVLIVTLFVCGDRSALNSGTNMTIARQQFGKHCLKAGIVEPERKPTTNQRLAKHTIPLQRIDTE